MKTEIKVPAVGESITSGILTSWLKQNGDTVEEGETLCELETEKTTLEVPAPAAGVLEILVQAEAEVQIGQVIGAISDEKQAPAEKPEQQPKEQPQKPAPKPQEKPKEPAPEPKKESKPQPAPAEKPTPAPAPHIEAEAVTPEVAPEQRNVRHPQQPPAAAPAAQLAGTQRRRTERVPMSGIRKKTADRLVKAQHTAAYLTTFNEIDMQKVVDIRSQYKDQFEAEHGIRIGYMSFFVKACCQALKEYPGVNAQLEENDIVYQYFYDIGVAISTETGLIVPIIRDADKLHFADIEAAVADLAKRAAGKKINPDELSGGTFTITNGGVFGSMLSTPIPAYPQTAILGMHAIKKRPVVIDEAIVIRPMMYVALSYDHRVIDGKQAIGFLATVKNYIEEPDKLLLEL